MSVKAIRTVMGSHMQLISLNSIMLSVSSNDPVVQDRHSLAFTLRGAVTAKRLLMLVCITWIIKARYGDKNKPNYPWCQISAFKRLHFVDKEKIFI